MAVQTPCVGVCSMHPIFRICRGCYRSPLELRLWNSASDKVKENIISGLSLKKKVFGDLTVGFKK